MTYGSLTQVLRVKYRDEWGAGPPAWEDSLNREPATKVFFHHHANLYGWRNGFSDEVRKIMQLTQDRHINHYGFSDIAYHFYIAGDGYVYEGREIKYNTPEKLRYNPGCYGNRIDICFLGDYLEKKVPDVMRKMAKMTVDYCINQGNLDPEFEKCNTFVEDKNPIIQRLHHYMRRVNRKGPKWKVHDNFHTSMYGKVKPVKPDYNIRPYHKGKHFDRWPSKMFHQAKGKPFKKGYKKNKKKQN